MIAAVYARKSTDQTGVVDEARSVARQVDHAKAYAARKGWTVDDAFVFVDDGISGAEFAGRPGFVRLMNALKPRAPFQVLVMSEEARLGREAIETAFAVKQLVTAGVRLFFYLEDRERTLDSPTDKLLMHVAAFADELEREKARQRTYDALSRKARAGYVTGGRVFGYDNVPVHTTDAAGTSQRSHVERRISEAEAEVVRRIFELCAAGAGKVRIAKTLNEDGAIAPRAQRGRPNAWAPSSIHEALNRELYRGVIVWNATRKRNVWGQKKQAARPAAELMRVAAPHLQIVDAALWEAAHSRLRAERERYLRGTGGKLWGRPRDVESRYLLTGFVRCGWCGGGVYVKTRDHRSRRAGFYGCSSYHKRGGSVCRNHLEFPLEAIDAVVIDALETEVLRADVIEEAIERAVATLAPERRSADADRVRVELQAVDVELERYSQAIAAGVALDAVVKAVNARQERREVLRRELVSLEQLAAPIDLGNLRVRLEAKAADWRGLLRRHVVQTRQVLRKLLPEPLVLTPYADLSGAGLAGTALLNTLITGLFPAATSLASPAGVEPASPP